MSDEMKRALFFAAGGVLVMVIWTVTGATDWMKELCLRATGKYPDAY